MVLWLRSAMQTLSSPWNATSWKSFPRSNKVLPTFPLPLVESTGDLFSEEDRGTYLQVTTYFKVLWTSASSYSLSFLSASLGNSQFPVDFSFPFPCLYFRTPPELYPGTDSPCSPRWPPWSHVLNTMLMLMFASLFQRAHLSRWSPDIPILIVIKNIRHHRLAHLLLLPHLC